MKSSVENVVTAVVKEAMSNGMFKQAKWDDMSLKEQKEYLQKHPKSKRRITAKPTKEKTDSKSPKYDVNRLTSVGIHKRIRAALGMADQYRDVNKNISQGPDNNYYYVYQYRSVPTKKLENIVKTLFGNTDRVKVADVDTWHDKRAIMIKKTEKEKNLERELDERLKNYKKPTVEKSTEKPSFDEAETILIDSMSENWDDSKIDDLKKRLIQHYPKSEKSIESIFTTASEASMIRHDMNDESKDDSEYNQLEKSYDKKSNLVLSQLKKIMEK